MMSSNKVVRQLNDKFGGEYGHSRQKSQIFSTCSSLPFLVGTTSTDDVMASILRFKMAAM